MTFHESLNAALTSTCDCGEVTFHPGMFATFQDGLMHRPDTCFPVTDLPRQIAAVTRAARGDVAGGGS